MILMWIEWAILGVILLTAIYFIVRHFSRQAQGKTACASCKTCEKADACHDIFTPHGDAHDGPDSDTDDDA